MSDMPDDPFASGHDDHTDDDDRPRSLAERAAAAAVGEDEEQQELFAAGVFDGDPKINFKTLIKPGDTVKTQVKMGSAAVPMRGEGLIDPTKEVVLRVRGFSGGYTETPKGEVLGDGTRTVEEWKVSVTIKPHHVEKLGTPLEAVRKIFVQECLPADVTEAMRLLDELNAAASEYLTSGVLPDDALNP